MTRSDLGAAREFLEARRIALVGLSRDEKDLSRLVFRELVRRGHDVVPVNPAMREAEGRPCFARVQDVDPPADAAILMTPPARTEEVVRDCLAAGVRRVWLHRGAGPGSATPGALTLCKESGILAVHGLCPFMAIPGAAWPHRLHGALRQAFGREAPR